MKKTKVKKILIIVIMLILTMGVSVVLFATEPETTLIQCEDIGLYNALIKDLGDEIYSSDKETKTIKIRTDHMNGITELKLIGTDSKIANLNGLQYFTNLKILNISSNNILKIEPISELSTLESLDISNNQSQITDIENLAKLTNIKKLSLESAKISNIDFASELINLQELNVANNSLSNVQAISRLNLETLNIAGNKSFNRFQEDIINGCSSIKNLDISSTGITSILYIGELKQLEQLKVAGLENVDLGPIVSTHTAIDEFNRKYQEADLINLTLLDISNSDNTLSFSSLSYLKKLKFLYMQDAGVKSVNYLYKLQNLEYINLNNNKITNIKEVYYERRNNTTGELSEAYYLPATTILLENNQIQDIEPLTYLKEKPIKTLNLKGNQISNITPLYSCLLAQNAQLYLQNQEITMKIYKKASVDQYIILPNIMQEAKKQNGLIYADNSNFVTKCNGNIDEESIRINNEEIYLKPNFYNVIINKAKTTKDKLTLELTGNSIASGSKITFELGALTSNIDSLLFKDLNLCEAIKEELAKQDKEVKSAHMILNLPQSMINAVTGMNLSNNEIEDLTGLENFTSLTKLNLSSNKITTIDQLQYCTNMIDLNVANNKIGDNNTAIEKMVKLRVLDLANTGMTQIDSIRTLIDYWITKGRGQFTLKTLNIAGNSFSTSDIDGIEKINTLEILNISNNKIDDIKKLETLAPNINQLNISHNQIEDISILNGFSNITDLYMSNNKISDITSIAGLSKIRNLDFSANKIKDISPLKNISGSGTLVTLNMNSNRIEDISAVDNVLINQLLSAEFEEITKIIPEEKEGKIDINLPQIFIASKTSSSQFYSTEELKVSVVPNEENLQVSDYCTLSSDNKSINVDVDKMEDKIILVKIQDGKADGTRLAIASPLKPIITYSVDDMNKKTNQDITATITFNRNNVTILNNEGKNTYTFTQNGEFTFEFIDEYGFEGTAKAEVKNIDKVAPTATVKQEIKNKQVIVSVEVSEKVKDIDGWEMTEIAGGKVKLTKTFAESAKETLKLVDEAGNESTEEIEVKVDKTAPVVTGIKNGEKYNHSVTPEIQDDSSFTVKLTKNGTVVANYKAGDEINDVGTYVLTVTDEFENTTTISFEIEKLSDIIKPKYENDVKVTEDEKIIKGIDPKTSVSNMKNRLQAEMNYDVLDKDGKKLADTANIGTGCQIKMESGKIYTVIVWGDLTGDGVIGLTELARTAKIGAEKIQPSAIEKLAIDINMNGKIELTELARIAKLQLGK